MSTTDYAISARGIQKRFGAVVAAADINIDVPTGQKVSLIGSNGAGKTTFVNMITGYIKPDEGQILLHGENIAGMEPRRIARMGVARSFQIPQLFKEMTVFDNMLVAIASQAGGLSFMKPARNHAAQERAAELLARFELSAHTHRTVGELPGGVRKLLDIAMALTRQPKVLLLDEPTSGVSSDEKHGLMATIMKALDQQKVSAIFVEHDVDIVSQYSTRVAAWIAGRIAADGEPSQVLADPEIRKNVIGE